MKAGERERGKRKKVPPSGAVSHSHRLYSVFLYGAKNCATQRLTACSRWIIKLFLDKRRNYGMVGRDRTKARADFRAR